MGAFRFFLLPALLVLGACERDFDEKYEDNLKALNAEAAQIKATADKQIEARQAAEKALSEGEGSDAQ